LLENVVSSPKAATPTLLDTADFYPEALFSWTRKEVYIRIEASDHLISEQELPNTLQTASWKKNRPENLKYLRFIFYLCLLFFFW